MHTGSGALGPTVIHWFWWLGSQSYALVPVTWVPQLRDGSCVLGPTDTLAPVPCVPQFYTRPVGVIEIRHWDQMFSTEDTGSAFMGTLPHDLRSLQKPDVYKRHSTDPGHNVPRSEAAEHVATPKYASRARIKLPRLEDIVTSYPYRWRAVTSRVAI
jgi:hypothetical protein